MVYYRIMGYEGGSEFGTGDKGALRSKVDPESRSGEVSGMMERPSLGFK